MDSLLMNMITSQTSDAIQQISTTEYSMSTDPPLAASVGGDVIGDVFGHHRLPCTTEETKQTACLNGGFCFAIPEGTARSTDCMCPSDFTGKRCEEIYIDLISLSTCSRGMITSSEGIAAVAALCSVLLGMAIMLFLFVYREKRKRYYSKIADTTDGVATTHRPLVQQISYSNYHGVRVLNNDQPIIEAVTNHCEGGPICHASKLPKGNMFSTFVNEGSDIGSANSGIKTVDDKYVVNNNTSKKGQNKKGLTGTTVEA